MWSLESDDGFPPPKKVGAYEPCIFVHFPEHLMPPKDNVTVPFSVGKERAARKIQSAWRHSIADPAYRVCRKRLLSEMEDLLAACETESI